MNINKKNINNYCKCHNNGISIRLKYINESCNNNNDNNYYYY